VYFQETQTFCLALCGHFALRETEMKPKAWFYAEGEKPSRKSTMKMRFLSFHHLSCLFVLFLYRFVLKVICCADFLCNCNWTECSKRKKMPRITFWTNLAFIYFTMMKKKLEIVEKFSNSHFLKIFFFTSFTVITGPNKYIRNMKIMITKLNRFLQKKKCWKTYFNNKQQNRRQVRTTTKTFIY